MTRALYIASTPLIALQAYGAALAQPRQRARLLLLGDFERAHTFAALLRDARDVAFEHIDVLPGRIDEMRDGGAPRAPAFVRRLSAKRTLRHTTLAAIRALDADFAPDAVWVGNDRKVETQLALHLASSRTGTRAGRYLDDGLFTYLGDVHARPLQRRIDAAIKRAVYGRWWQQATRAGTTRWIDAAYVAYPDLAPHANARPLPRGWFARRAFVRLALAAARAFGLDRDALGAAGALLVLPHSKQLRDDPSAARRLRDAAAAVAAGRRLAVKYHPRESAADPAGVLAGADVIALPAQLPLELLLQLLPRGIALLGEGSTALMAAHWLRPDLDVRDLGLSAHPYALKARGLFARLGIGVAGADAPAAAAAAQLAYS